MTGVTIGRAGMADLDDAAVLFDAYRIFYKQPGDRSGARAFLKERLEAGSSIVLLARDSQGRAVGFLQVYPGFSSVSLGPVWQLNDLFVAPEARRGGVADALMADIERRSREAGVNRLGLETAVDNGPAQALYLRRGWRRVDDLEQFELRLTDPGS